MKQAFLDDFGKLLIEKVYDQTIDNYKDLIECNIKAPRLKELAEKVSLLSSKEKEIVDKIVFEVIDDILFHFLSVLEDDDKLRLLYYKDKKTACDLVKISDGLAGELVAEDGWICKYSKYRNNIEC